VYAGSTTRLTVWLFVGLAIGSTASAEGVTGALRVVLTVLVV